MALFGVLAYLPWFVIGYVLEQRLQTVYAPYLVTLPFRLLVGMLCWIGVMLWYRLQALRVSGIEAKDAVEERELQLERVSMTEPTPEEVLIEKCIDRRGSLRRTTD